MRNRHASRLVFAVATVVAMVASGVAYAQTKVKIGALRTLAMTPVFHAKDAGYFKQEGLDIEFVTLGTGPAIGAAVASGSVQVGYSAMIPVIFARAQGQPFRVFANLTRESGTSEGRLVWLVTAEKSSIRDMKDLSDKTVMTNGASSLCELAFRDHAAAAGIEWKTVKTLTAPFSQMPAALEIGNADAACVVEPFYTLMRQSPRIKAKSIASGQIASIKSEPGVALDVLYVDEQWGEKNKDVLQKINRAVAKSVTELMSRPEDYKKLLATSFKLEAGAVNEMKTRIFLSDFTPNAAMVSPLVEALRRNGMLDKSVEGQDVILQIP